jgi:hypothetical protein
MITTEFGRFLSGSMFLGSWSKVNGELHLSGIELGVRSGLMNPCLLLVLEPPNGNPDAIIDYHVISQVVDNIPPMSTCYWNIIAESSRAICETEVFVNYSDTETKMAVFQKPNKSKL